MNKILYLPLMLIFNTALVYSQNKLTGLWYSEDSTRVYCVNKFGNEFKAVIQTSKRKLDTSGAVILTEIHYLEQKKRFHGVIYSVKDRYAKFVKIFIVDDGKALKIKIPRMLIFPVSIKWIKLE